MYSPSHQFCVLGQSLTRDCCSNCVFFLVSTTNSVRPPKKSWKNISNLSGGEKTLSSLALVGALVQEAIPMCMHAHTHTPHSPCRCLLSTITSHPPYTLWMKLTLLWTSEMSPSLLTTSRYSLPVFSRHTLLGLGDAWGT